MRNVAHSPQEDNLSQFSCFHTHHTTDLIQFLVFYSNQKVNDYGVFLSSCWKTDVALETRSSPLLKYIHMSLLTHTLIRYTGRAACRGGRHTKCHRPLRNDPPAHQCTPCLQCLSVCALTCHSGLADQICDSVCVCVYTYIHIHIAFPYKQDFLSVSLPAASDSRKQMTNVFFWAA